MTMMMMMMMIIIIIIVVVVMSPTKPKFANVLLHISVKLKYF